MLTPTPGSPGNARRATGPATAGYDDVRSKSSLCAFAALVHVCGVAGLRFAAIRNSDDDTGRDRIAGGVVRSASSSSRRTVRSSALEPDCPATAGTAW